MQEEFIYGGRSPQARTVVVYGNCQAPYLAMMLASLDDLNDDYRFAVVFNHALPGEPVARPLPPACSDIALVLWQYEDGHSNPAAVALKALLPPGCPQLRYPTYWLSCLWPFECPDPRIVAEPEYPWTRYPHGDLIGLEIAKAGLSGPLAVAAYMDLSQRRMPDLQVRLERDLSRMRRHDAQCDVQLTEFVEANFRREHLFWSFGHVSRSGVCELAQRVADAARPVLGGSALRARQCTEAAAGFDGMGVLQPPIHPVVAEAFGLGYCSLDRTWQWYGQQWTYYEYLQRYIAYDTNW